MEKQVYQNYIAILEHELIEATGCTQPIAIAYAGARARAVLGREPERCLVRCSGNIVKNVKGVVVPASGGRRGIEAAAILGIVGGDPDRRLEVLQDITPAHREKMEQLLAEGFCRCELAEGVENLYIDLTLYAGEEWAEVLIQDTHTHIAKIIKNGELVEENQLAQQMAEPDKSCLNIRQILEFGDTAELADVKDLIEKQIHCNETISKEGLSSAWGACVGQTLLRSAKAGDLKARACAAAAAGSDARMAGCALPVVINSGSGNQGITVSLPLLTYAEAYEIPREKLIRSLCVANLISVHQKKYIGRLSAYCGVVSAACAAACGIAYMLDDSYEVIARTITNTICTVGGIVCDGAKSSCAAKIAASLNAALTAWEMARSGLAFQPGEGLVGKDVEETIAKVGTMGREGMKETDVRILKLMLGE